MAPTNLRLKRTYADITESPLNPRFKDIDEIEYSDTFFTWSMCVKVDVKFRPNSKRDNLRFILMDKTGSKIEAIVEGYDQVERFNAVVHTGCKYILHHVTIHPNYGEVLPRNIGHAYECILAKKTIVDPCPWAIEFPLFPKYLLPFREVVEERRNKSFVDIAGVIVDIGINETIGRYPNAVRYRQLILMDLRCNLMAVGIWGRHESENSYYWSTAEEGKHIVIATMLQKDYKFGCLNTSEHTIFAFNLDHPSARPLQDIRQKVKSGAFETFIQKFREGMWAYLATVVRARKPA